MKTVKLTKTRLLCFVLCLVIALPFSLFACDLERDPNSGATGETTAEKKNYARYFKLRLTRPSGVSTGEADAERFISALFRELGFSL